MYQFRAPQRRGKPIEQQGSIAQIPHRLGPQGHDHRLQLGVDRRFRRARRIPCGTSSTASVLCGEECPTRPGAPPGWRPGDARALRSLAPLLTVATIFDGLPLTLFDGFSESGEQENSIRWY